MKISILKKLIKLTTFFVFVFVFTQSQMFSATAKNPKTDVNSGSGSWGPCDYTYTVKVTYTDVNQDGTYDHSRVDITIKYNCGLLGSGNKTITLYDGNFMLRGSDGSGYINYDPSLDPSFLDSLSNFSFTPESCPCDSLFSITEYHLTYEDINTQQVSGEYIKYTTDSIPLYTSYRVSIMNKSTTDNQVNVEIEDFLNSFNIPLPIVLFPNPIKSTAALTVGYNYQESNEAIITLQKMGITSLDYVKIYNEKGEVVWQSNEAIDLDKLPYDVKVNNLPNGVYFLETQVAGKWKGSKSFVVAK